DASIPFVGAAPPLRGSASLQDGSSCGTSNEFFGVKAVATAVLLDAQGAVLGIPWDLDEYGRFVLPVTPSAVSVGIQCEGGNALTLPVSTALMGLFPPAQLPNPVRPDVSSMTATYNGTAVGTFNPPPSGFPSDKIPPSDKFLAEKGLDTR